MKKQKNIQFLKKGSFVLLIAILMWLSFGAGIYLSGKNELVRSMGTKEAEILGVITGKYTKNDQGILSQDVDFDLFWETWNTLREYYVDESDLNEKDMFYGALKGLVDSVGDPYTVFMRPQLAKEFNDDLEGKFEGIGAEVGMRDDIVTVIAPLPGMPAEAAGLEAGDKILLIDSESTAGLTISEAVGKIRGEKGTEVVLGVAREGANEIIDIPITRNTIIVKSVNFNMRDDGIYVIKISSFNADTAGLFNDAVEDLMKKNPKGIILDLRNNPGGYLDTAIEMSSEWIENGLVVSERYSDEKIIEHLARGRARLAGIPTVILVNGGSASASEIVAGALQDYDFATIIGTKTYGKGSVQNMTNLGDGSSIKITIAKWLTPEGRSINDEGIAPDTEIKYTIEDYESDKDPQMEEAVKHLLKSDN